ncbi:MAG: ABC transporter permease [Clostridiales bacterium]|nr:ABC transporter permease [Clostridiales bacterium]
MSYDEHDNLDALFVPHEYSKGVSEKIEYSNYSYWRSTFRAFGKNKVGMFALFLAVAVILFAVLEQFFPNEAGKIAIEKGRKPFDYIFYIMDSTMWKKPPTALHWFGTDGIGRDLWSRVWYSTRISLSISFIVALIEIIVGFIVGAIWGYVRSVDKYMIEIYNAIMNIPQMILFILMTYILAPGYWTIILSLSIVGWLSMAKYTRNLVFIIRDREYNLASRCLGTPMHRMITRNLLPHLLSVIMLRFSLLIVSVIAVEVTLTYLGVGLPPEIPSLGVLISEGRTQITFRPHLMTFPTIVVALITISFYIVGNTLADASDPRNHV